MVQENIKTRSVRLLDIAFILGGIVILFIFTTVYLMPFRLDDVLHMDWARDHTFWDSFDAQRGEIVRSVRPVFAMMIWILTHTAGIEHYFPWHLTLVGSFFIGLAYAGKTARFITKDNTALYYTTGFFWLAFLPILNVLFWYGDLTFTIELMFVATSWYYGLRGLLEGRIGLWIVATLSGILAVLSKEPALLLVHGIFVGAFVMRYSDIKKAWAINSLFNKLFAISVYVVFLAISLKLYYASPTRSNRFFNISALTHDQLSFFVNDRLRYYGESLLNPIARILLVTPLLYSVLRQFIREGTSLFKCCAVLIISLLIAFLAVKSLPVLGVVLIFTPIINIIREKNNRIHKLLLPFSIAAIIILAVLLITVMLVKTQLTELSFVILVISGAYWALMVKEIASFAKPYLADKRVHYSLTIISILAISAGMFSAFPMIKSKEHLLSEVRDVRNNANDAIKWMGANLPLNSSVLVAAPSLYGLGGADEMTSKDDEYKLYAQYTFLQGYIRSYFRALHREDISLGYLEDSLKLSKVLNSVRSQDNYFLFLQTGLDVDRFHGIINGNDQLSSHDSLLSKFTKGSFPSEIWELKK